MKVFKVAIFSLVVSVGLFSKAGEIIQTKVELPKERRLPVKSMPAKYLPEKGENGRAERPKENRVAGMFIRRLVRELRTEKPEGLPKNIAQEIEKKNVDLQKVFTLLEAEENSEWLNEFKDIVQDKKVLIAGIKRNKIIERLDAEVSILKADVSLLKNAYMDVQRSNKELVDRVGLLLKNK